MALIRYALIAFNEQWVLADAAPMGKPCRPMAIPNISPGCYGCLQVWPLYLAIFLPMPLNRVAPVPRHIYKDPRWDGWTGKVPVGR